MVDGIEDAELDFQAAIDIKRNPNSAIANSSALINATNLNPSIISKNTSYIKDNTLDYSHTINTMNLTKSQEKFVFLDNSLENSIEDTSIKQ